MSGWRYFGYGLERDYGTVLANGTGQSEPFAGMKRDGPLFCELFPVERVQPAIKPRMPGFPAGRMAGASFR